MSATQPSSQPMPANRDGTNPPNMRGEPEPPSTKDLPDLPEPHEVGEAG
jgi:hypothetical protein